MKSLVMIVLFCLLPAAAQNFNSGSNGSDGDLTFPNAKSGDVIIFDPRNTTLFPGGLDNDHDNVFHFKSVVIPAGVRVVLRADKLGGPVYWLVQGNVQIAGQLDLDGNNGAANGTFAQTFAVPGPGGFYGGGGGDTASRPPTAGFGPLPGVAGNPKGTGGCDTTYGGGGGFTGNEFLVPLIGGSGGGGYFATYPSIGPGGGAGGGAILIAASGTITIPSGGSIVARGGVGVSYWAGAGNGAGGAIRLAASRIDGSGLLSAAGRGNNCSASGANGRVRLEAFQQLFAGSIEGDARSATPFDTFVPTATSPSLRVISVGGVNVTAFPAGTFEAPDVTINSDVAVPIVIETKNVPAGTVVHLQLFSETGASQTVDFPAVAGSGATFQATASVKFPSGFSRGLVRASFTR